MKLSAVILIFLVIDFGTTQIMQRQRLNPLSGIQKSLHSFTVSLQNRIKNSRSAYGENIERALRTSKIYTGGKLKPRLSDNRLPYFNEKTVNAPQQYRNKSFLEFDRRVVKFIARAIGGNMSNPYIIASAKKYKKLQDELPESVPFPCSLEGARSQKRPTSADKVRPGDIDLIGVMGDSLMAGYGLIGTNVIQFSIMNEGLSAVTGGYQNWRKIFTIANMLKEFNPNLIGYATRDSLFSAGHDPKSYNVASPATLVDDFPNMARTFVAKMRRDPRVNIEKDWKFVVYFGGSVDMCGDVCYWKNIEDAPAYHYKLMEEALDYLMENSPRTIIYFLISPNVPRLHYSLKNRGALCEEINKLECSCIRGEIFKSNREKYFQLMDKLVEAQIELLNQPKYQQKLDFAVVPDPLLSNVSYPVKKSSRGREADYRYLSPDCFHFSQRGHAAMANSLWNSLFTPLDKKEHVVNWKLYEKVLCPTKQQPYIVTMRNSSFLLKNSIERR